MASSELITGSLSMKGMRFPLHVILTALIPYFLSNYFPQPTPINNKPINTVLEAKIK